MQSSQLDLLNQTSDPIDRMAPTVRPVGRATGFHCWWDLTFLHWRFPAEQIAKLLPPELTLDTWDGDAWVGLVPFRMSGIRPWWFPAIPGVSAFAETNVRTYVHHRNGSPGVWFFSLDAARSLPVRVARWKWHLPYYRADMTTSRQGSRISYQSRRLWPGTAGPATEVEVEIGDLVGASETSRPRPAGQAIPGTLEHFLVERYIMYARTKGGKLLAGRVHHTPYQLRETRVLRCQESLLSAMGLATKNPPAHAIFSDGVRVDVFPLLEVR